MSRSTNMPYGSGFSPLLGEPRMGLIPLPQKVATAFTLTTAGGARTCTADECLGGLFLVNCDDAQTMTLPTATLLNAAIPGVAVGTAFDFDVINSGDTTLTVAVGTGGTLVVGSNSTSTVATIVAKASKRFTVLITAVPTPGADTSTNSYILIGYGSIAAAVA